MEWLTDPHVWTALTALTALEIALGVDNVVFLSILAGQLPRGQQEKARRVGLLLALVMRVGLLLSLSWVIRLTAPLFTVSGRTVSAGDLIRIAGGLFLMARSTRQLQRQLEGRSSDRVCPSFGGVIAQLVLLDAVFSLDSVITAVGRVEQAGVVVAAVVTAGAFMIVLAGPIAAFVGRHPAVRVLALCFLLLIGVTLVAEGLVRHLPKGYVYSAMAGSVFVEFLNLRPRKPREEEPAHPHGQRAPPFGPGW